MIEPRNRALLKCVTFCYFIFVLFFGVKSPIYAQAEIQSDSITIQAVVPLQDGFVRLLETQSRVRGSDSIRYPRERTMLSISLMASGKETFRHHRLRVELTAENGKILNQWFETTDEMGNASLAVELEDIIPGRYRFRVWDIFYPKRELLLHEQPILSILEFPVDDDADVVALKKKKMAFTSHEIAYTDGETTPNLMKISTFPQTDEHRGNPYFKMHSGP